MISLKQGDKVGPWSIIEKIGEGEYGSVYSGSCNESKNTEYAVKVAPLNKKKKSFEASLISNEVQFLRVRLKAFANDYAFLPHFPHQFSYKHITGDTENGKIRYLAMERMDMTLKEYCMKRGGRLSPSEIYSIAVQLLSVFQFFHNSYTLYNDIKPENFMLRKTPEGYQLVAIDFGAMKIKFKGKPAISDGLCGTPLYMSINNERGGDLYCSDDVVALGYMLAALFLGELPWKDGHSHEEIIQMKQQQRLDDLLQAVPEVRSFIHAFEFCKTDDIRYDEWIARFKKSPHYKSFYLPYPVVPSDLPPNPPSHRKSVKRGRNDEPLTIQKVINQSPHSMIQKVQMQLEPSAELVRSISRRRQNKMPPTRVQPHRTCKKRWTYLFQSNVFCKKQCTPVFLSFAARGCSIQSDTS